MADSIMYFIPLLSFDDTDGLSRFDHPRDELIGLFLPRLLPRGKYTHDGPVMLSNPRSGVRVMSRLSL